MPTNAPGSSPSDEEHDAIPNPAGLAVTSLEDLRSLDLTPLLADQLHADGFQIEQALQKAAESHEIADSATGRAFRLWFALCSFHLVLEPEGEPFAPRWSAANGTRTIIPSDLRGEQSAVLATLAPEIPNPFLRARAAEVAYVNGDRRLGATAIDAYSELVSQRLGSTPVPESENHLGALKSVLAPIERAFQINALVARRGTVTASLRDAHALAYGRAISECAYFEFQSLARIGLHNKLLEAEDVARIATNLAEGAPDTIPCMIVRDVWLLAAEAHERHGNEGECRAASLKAVDQTLRMQHEVGPNAARAHWIKCAISELRQLGGCQDQLDDLRKQLRDVQDRSLEEFSRISTPVDHSELRATTEEHFSRLDLPEAMLEVIRFLIPPSVDTLKQEALEIARRTPFSSMFASSYADFEGKEVARGEMLDFDADPSEEWFKEQSFRHQAFHRHAVMLGQVEPARRAIASRFPLQDRHFLPVAALSPFVPISHRHIFAMGFARLWQGDYVTAGHLLIPQLENSLRHVLSLSGVDSSKIEEDGIQGDRALSMLMTVTRAQLTDLFGEDVVWQIDTLYNARTGSRIRHELAHGKIGWNAFYSPEVMLASWFVYYTTMLPLADNWEDMVAPHIREML